MACNNLLTTSLLHVVNRLFASLLSKLVIHRHFYKLFQQVVISLQITICNKADFNNLMKLMLSLYNTFRAISIERNTVGVKSMSPV